MSVNDISNRTFSSKMATVELLTRDGPSFYNSDLWGFEQVANKFS